MFPLAIWLAILATGTTTGLGLGAGIEAMELFNQAQDIANRSKRRLEEAINKAKKKEMSIQNRFDTFRNLLIEIENTTFSKLKSLIKDASSNQDIQREITNIARKLQSNNHYNPTLNTGNVFGDLICSLAKGVSLSAATPMLLTQLAIMFGTASTGTAISTLSGIAAEKAIMAWLGGGALSAGGWGVAGGALVCNAITFGIGILVAGVVLNNKAEKALTEAKAYSGQVDLEVTKIDNSIKYEDVFERKIIIVNNSVNEINELMKQHLFKVYTNSLRQEAVKIIKAIALASILKTILKTDLHDKNLQEIEKILNEKLNEGKTIIASIN